MRIDKSGVTPIGTIATGWYPTAVALDRRANALYIANGKGEGGHANPGYAPLARVHAGDDRPGYIAGNLAGSIRRLAMPSR